MIRFPTPGKKRNILSNMCSATYGDHNVIYRAHKKLCEVQFLKMYRFLQYKRCSYEVPGMILLRDLEEVMRLDRSKDVSVHVSTCTKLRFQCINVNYVEGVALKDVCVFTFRRKNE
jgi:hypothetical protein